MTKKKSINDQKGNTVEIGDFVFYNLYRDSKITTRPTKILCVIQNINGGYVYAKHAAIRDCVYELYNIEFIKASNEEATLWLLENK